MAKVLVDGRVLNHPQMSGVERYVTELCRALQEIKTKHRFLVARPPWSSRFLSHIWEHFYLPALCVKEKADLLFCPANIAPLVRPRRARLVVTIHGLAFRYYPGAYATDFNYYYSHLIPRVLRSADAILAVSSSEKKSILDQYGWVDQKKIYAIHSGINHDMFKAESKENARELLRQRFGISEKFVLSVGSLSAVKNVRRLIEAFLQIPSLPDIRLVLVCGSGPYRYEAGEEMMHPRLRIVNDVGEDLPCFYRAAELTVLPSKYEGFGFPALEAMACGCPVVSSNVSALREICGDAAVYVDPDDTQSISGGIQQVLNNGRFRHDLIVRGIRRAKEFTWERTARDTLKVFDALMGDH